MDELHKLHRRSCALALWRCASVAWADRCTVALFVPASTAGAPQGVLGILSDAAAGTVAIQAIDDAGARTGAAAFTLNTRAAVEPDASDLAHGNAAKGLTGRTGTGDWRLEIDTVRGTEVADRSTFRVPIFNPGTEVTRTSRLRPINPGGEVANESMCAPVLLAQASRRARG